MDNYQDYDALGLAALIARGDVSAAEVLEAAKTRAAQVNPQINAIVANIEPPPSAASPAKSSARPRDLSPECHSCSKTSASR
jgi:Asp-tRNA(Asn)/Glu-tRNA(Gln) amidotransferase A subunit family amidase